MIYPYSQNNKDHPDKQVELIAASIRDFGWQQPIKVGQDNIIIVGHGRFQAYQEYKEKYKLKDMWIVDKNGVTISGGAEEKELTEQEERKYRLLDNRISEYAKDNLENIRIELDELQDQKLNDLYDLGMQTTEEERREEIEDDVPDIGDDIVVEKGDIFQLGEHRLMCGDATSIDDVEKLMDGQKADMVFTDPPYGMFLDTDYSKIKVSAKSIGFKGNKVGNKYDKVIGDNEDFNPDFINTIFGVFGYCKEIFIWGSDYFVDLLPNYGKDGSWIVWNKRSSEAQQRGIGSCFELCWSKQKHKRLVMDFEWFGFLSKDDSKEARNRVHPTMKPTKLMARFLDTWGKDGDKVVDLFGGSGSTLIACEKTNRKCYMMELDPKYIQVIIKRYYDYTNGGEVKCLNRELDLSDILNPSQGGE